MLVTLWLSYCKSLCVSDAVVVLLGIWTRDMRFKSNLPLTEVNKILKNLESKKLIKAVKSVAVSSVYAWSAGLLTL